ncbi:MAG: hypothetical protein AAF532_13950 [Planctomycetota bacterium]
MPDPPMYLFGPPRYSEEDQRAFPDKPFTRVVKDVIRVGEWHTVSLDDGTETVVEATPALLSTMVVSHVQAKAGGVAANLGMSHGDLETRVIPTAELIAPVDELIFDGTHLWASHYTTPAVALWLQNPAIKVSPGMWPDKDGEGRTYAYRLAHIAATDRPVVTGQGTFLALNQRPAKRDRRVGRWRTFRRPGVFLNRRYRAMAENEGDNSGSGEGTGEALTGGGDLAISGAGVATLMNLIVDLLPEGVSLPEGTDETNVVERLGVIVSTLKSMDAPSGSTLDSTVEVAGDAAMMTQSITKAVANAVRPLTDRLDKIERQSAAMMSQIGSPAQARFMQECEALATKGVPPAVLDDKKKLGAKTGWDLALLSGLVPAVSLSQRSRKGGHVAPPGLPEGGGSAMSPEEREERVKARVARTRGA